MNEEGTPTGSATEPQGTPATGEGTPATGDGATGTTGTAATMIRIGEIEFTPEQIKAAMESNDRMAKALKKANAEAAKNRKAAEGALSEEEQAAQELQTLREQQKQWQVEKAELFISSQIGRLAGKLGIVDTEIVEKVIDWDDLEFDAETGLPTNVESVVTDLIRKKPYLAGKGTPARPTPVDATAGANGQGTPPQLTAAELAAAQAAGMDPGYYQQMKNVRTLKDWQQHQRKP